MGSSATTNVWLTYQLVKPNANDGTPQLAYYHPGVGTGGFIDRVIGGATGYGLNRNIQECYRFLIDHYHPGDYVYLFGFSRGAYTVRSLAGLVRNCGIINPEKLPIGKSLDADGAGGVQAVSQARRCDRAERADVRGLPRAALASGFSHHLHRRVGHRRLARHTGGAARASHVASASAFTM